MRTFVWIAVLTSLVSCSQQDSRPSVEAPETPSVPKEDLRTPEEIVELLVHAYLGKRLGEYYDLVASIDKEVRTLESLQEEFAPSSSDLVTDYLFSRTRFRVDSSSVEGDSALVYVTSESPDVGTIIREAAVVERSLGPESDLGMKMSLLNERLRLSGGARVENPTVYFLVREPKGWRVVLGWADRKAFEDQMRADSAQAGGT